MRTRYKSYSDYGISMDLQKKLIVKCRNLEQQDRLHLFQSAISAAPGLEIPIYESLTTGSGYRTMLNIGKQIPAKEDDFYAYRRKTLATFYDRLRLFGRWKD